MLGVSWNGGREGGDASRNIQLMLSLWEFHVVGHYVAGEEGECGWLGRMNVRMGGEGVCWGWVGECVSVEVGWGRVNGCV